MLLPKRRMTSDPVVVWRGMRLAVCPVVSAMTPQEQVQFARYKEAVVRSDDTIAALERVIVVQREVIDLLHAQIGKMEGQMAELQAAL